MISARLASRIFCRSRRELSTDAVLDLDKWIESTRTRVLQVEDYFNTHHLANLYATLPTTVHSSRDRIQRHRVYPGHHLVFFNASNPESSLRHDGSDADFGPPNPFSRRMWAGGSMRWNTEYARNMAVGTVGTAWSQIAEVKKVGFETDTPMVFVKQNIGVVYGEKDSPLVEEERTHVYIPPNSGLKRSVKSVDTLPDSVDFSYTFTTTPTTLFRFSALTFNGHYIHLDADYARKEGYEERLVHAPLSAMMMLETLRIRHPEASLLLKSFQYRAVNPMTLNKQLTIRGSWNNRRDSAVLWLINEDGHVGMTGNVELSNPCPDLPNVA